MGSYQANSVRVLYINVKFETIVLTPKAAPKNMLRLWNRYTKPISRQRDGSARSPCAPLREFEAGGLQPEPRAGNSAAKQHPFQTLNFPKAEDAAQNQGPALSAQDHQH